jgi:hypothetical protein
MGGSTSLPDIIGRTGPSTGEATHTPDEAEAAYGVPGARHALGRQLAALRKAAGYSQHEFAPLTLYGRSTLANVETGRQNVPREFWQRCDAALGAGGALVAGFEAIQALRRRAHRRAAEDTAGRLVRAATGPFGSDLT